jgi:transposase
MAHPVKLMPAKAVKLLVGGKQSNAHNARALWTAVQQPNLKAVAVKAEEQQVIPALHRIRPPLVKFRTTQINGLRRFLTEYGEVQSPGKVGIAEALQRRSDRLPARDALREQGYRIGKLDEPIHEIEHW